MILIYFFILFILTGFVTSSCDCCGECKIPQESSCPEIKYVTDGLSGSGGLSRYWNCCKPRCASTTIAGAGNETRQCDSYMHRLFDYSATSKCDGGSATACFSQVPFLIDGCDNIGFAFGAVPSLGCGKCFLLEFTGKGAFTTKGNHRALKTKKLIMMAIDKSFHASDGTFEILVPGGGVGIYKDRCLGVFSTDIGDDWGGLLSVCEAEDGLIDTEEHNNARKQCLVKKCTEAFTGEAREGCLFYSYFLEAASNPTFTYKEIECPQVLKDKYN